MPHFASMMRTGINTGVLADSHAHSRARGGNFCSHGLLMSPGTTLAVIHIKTSSKSFYIPVPHISTFSMETPLVFFLPHWPFLLQVLWKTAMIHMWATMWLPCHRKRVQRKLLALTSAGPASSADSECRGAFPTDGGGLQHGLHVLMLCSVFSILQPLGLALAGGWAAGELAGLREENRFVVLTETSMENRPEM